MTNRDKNGKFAKEKKPIDWRIICFAIACLTILELGAMHYGINGKMFTLILAVIAGLAGLSLPQIKLKGN